MVNLGVGSARISTHHYEKHGKKYQSSWYHVEITETREMFKMIVNINHNITLYLY